MLVDLLGATLCARSSTENTLGRLIKVLVALDNNNMTHQANAAATA